MVESPLHPKNTRAKEFRYNFADTIGLQFNGNQAIITFSIANNPSDPSQGAQEQVAVAMVAVVAKSLASTLGIILSRFEKSTGTVLPFSVPPELEKALQEADAKSKQNQ
jgi:hypothetical protein